MRIAVTLCNRVSGSTVNSFHMMASGRSGRLSTTNGLLFAGPKAKEMRGNVCVCVCVYGCVGVGPYYTAASLLYSTAASSVIAAAAVPSSAGFSCLNESVDNIRLLKTFTRAHMI